MLSVAGKILGALGMFMEIWCLEVLPKQKRRAPGCRQERRQGPGGVQRRLASSKRPSISVITRDKGVPVTQWSKSNDTKCSRQIQMFRKISCTIFRNAILVFKS
ncbi:hypothetical protein SK128_018736 [Halocaridina rubra]|uniref:Uncharacterized protein n=1 Tax=Halocaridina rubra TaxID=373956 RepID=A0AAN9A852_HALRR